MIKLLPCNYRQATINDGKRHVCTHQRMCAPLPSRAVLDMTCRECEFCRWVPDLAVEQYTPRRKTSPTVQQYADRVGTCSPCDFRRENYCRKAGTACGLLSALAKTSFVCPIEKFGRADERKKDDDAVPQPASAVETDADESGQFKAPALEPAEVDTAREIINGAHAASNGDSEDADDAARKAGEIGSAGGPLG